jgi:gluconolactonase
LGLKDEECIQVFSNNQKLRERRVNMRRTMAICMAITFMLAFGLMSSPAMAGMKVLPRLSIDDITVGPPQKWVQGGKFLEGPIADLEGNIWVVSIASGWISKISPNGKWVDVFHSGGQPQGLEWGKDGRLYGTDRKRGVFVYDPKTKVVSDYVRYFQNENFHGPNDLIFDHEGGLYFTDPWGTSPVNPRGGVYYVSPGGKCVRRLINNLHFPNGISMSPDDKNLYIGDCFENKVITAPIESPGIINIGFTHVSTYLNGGMGPDGNCVDEKGNLYQSQYAGGRVFVIAPDGNIIGTIPLPAGEGSETTNCCFGIGKDSSTLYITEAGDDVIWKVKTKVRGLKLWRDM